MSKIKERENLIRELKIYLPQLMLEILRDPDFGLEIREEIKEKLERIRKKKVKFFSKGEVKEKDSQKSRLFSKKFRQIDSYSSYSRSEGFF